MLKPQNSLKEFLNELKVLNHINVIALEIDVFCYKLIKYIFCVVVNSIDAESAKKNGIRCNLIIPTRL